MSTRAWDGTESGRDEYLNAIDEFDVGRGFYNPDFDAEAETAIAEFQAATAELDQVAAELRDNLTTLQELVARIETTETENTDLRADVDHVKSLVGWLIIGLSAHLIIALIW